MSPVTFARNLTRLKTDGLLGWNIKSPQINGFVSSQISYSTVGLQQIAVFMAVPQRNLEIVEKMCDIHPYTTYMVRCLGTTNGIFALFAIPANSLYLLRRLLEIMKEKGIFTNFSYSSEANQQIYTEADFRLYDNRTGTWNFDWDGWRDMIIKGNPFELKPLPPSVLHRMRPEDMQILNQLSIDARKERKEIAEEIGIQPYHLSRRLKFYHQNNVIASYRIIHGLASLNLVTPALVECMVDGEVKERIAYAASRLPFQGNFISTEKGFIFYSTLPAPDFPKLAGALLEQAAEADLMWCDYASSVRFWFDSDAESNFRNGSWLATKEFMLDNVLEGIGLEVV
jgi:DNA-binding Lrp family transcriptional regulator